MATNNEQYKSAYSTMIGDLINKAINREAFNYDPATDAAYQSYAKQYARLGDEAARDTLGDVAASTGGLASSYAVTAAQQARNNYNQALTDKIPALMEAAYDKYRNEYNDTLAGINTLQGLDDSAYNRFSTDRSFNESVRQYNQNYELDKNAQQFEQMLNRWTTLGYATKDVAKFFGIPEGTKTDDSSYRWAQFALQQATAGSSGGSGGGRTTGGRPTGRTDTATPEQSLANSATARVINAATNTTAAITGGTDNAKAYLSRLGQYLAQGGTTGDRQASAIEKVKNDNRLSSNEKLWILQQLSK